MALEDRMQVDEGSSGGDLSTPPRSPEAPSSGGDPSDNTIHVLGVSAPATASATPAPAPAPTKRRYNRKSNTNVQADAADDSAKIVKEKRPRKPRAPRDPNAPPTRRRTKGETVVAVLPDEKPAPQAHIHAQPQPQPAQQPSPLPEQRMPVTSIAATATPSSVTASPSAAVRKSHTGTATPTQQHRQTRITDLVGVIRPENPPTTTAPLPSTARTPELKSEPIHNSTVITSMPHPTLSHLVAAQPTPRPASSGQVYDPIRSATAETSSSSRKIYENTNSAPVSPPQRYLNRASASPSINSLIDPPTVSNSIHSASIPSSHAHPTPPTHQQTRVQQPLAVTSAPASPAPGSVKPAAATSQLDRPQAARSNYVSPVASIPGPVSAPAATVAISTATPMEIDSATSETSKPAPPTTKKVEAASVTPPVKPVRQKEPAPPLPTGSGLLSGTPFGLAASSGASSEAGTSGTNIFLSFNLKGQNNVTINFAREVEKKYGFAALYPRIAAQKERRRQIAAASAALDKPGGAGSADDMSLDLSEPESNPEMEVEADGDASATDGTKKRKRKKRTEDYDKDDDFIDDTELAWEQQALMAQDGFFVYSGPLVPEGEKPAVERADGTVKRGRGRGRGGSTRGDASTRGSRGGGRGSRGGTTVRKPRVTKADRAMMEQEKLQRERLANSLAAKPATQASGQTA